MDNEGFEEQSVGVMAYIAKCEQRVWEKDAKIKELEQKIAEMCDMTGVQGQVARLHKTIKDKDGIIEAWQKQWDSIMHDNDVAADLKAWRKMEGRLYGLCSLALVVGVAIGRWLIH